MDGRTDARTYAQARERAETIRTSETDDGTDGNVRGRRKTLDSLPPGTRTDPARQRRGAGLSLTRPLFFEFYE